MGGEPLLDLCTDEDVRADMDMNVVMNRDGHFIEVQGTAERQPFDRTMLEPAARRDGRWDRGTAAGARPGAGVRGATRPSTMLAQGIAGKPVACA